MKYLVISDIHGVLEYASRIDDIVSIEKPSNIILLGDIYYNYRNSLEDNSIKISEILNKYKDIILCTRGNCDSEYDEVISNFIFKDYIELNINGKVFFFTHGHKYNINNIPEYVDVLVFGHLHTHFIKTINNVLCINSGSISLPRNNTKNSYTIITNDEIIIKDINYNIIDSVKY